jgi:hypothetical protein
MYKLFVIALVLIAAPALAQDLVINEALISVTGTDYDEYVELCGPPDMALDGYAVIVIEGQGSGWGYVDRIWPLDGYVVPADGLFAMTNDGMANQDYSIGTSNSIENGTETVLLVYGLPPEITTATDVDTNDDGIEEVSVGTIIDGFCITDGDPTDFCYYGVPTYGPDGTYFPGGVARCGDCTGDYVFMCYNITGCVDPFYADSTPGLPNDCPASPVEESSWGTVKALYR